VRARTHGVTGGAAVLRRGCGSVTRACALSDSRCAAAPRHDRGCLKCVTSATGSWNWRRKSSLCASRVSARQSLLRTGRRAPGAAPDSRADCGNCCCCARVRTHACRCETIQKREVERRTSDERAHQDEVGGKSNRLLAAQANVFVCVPVDVTSSCALQRLHAGFTCLRWSHCACGALGARAAW
jgi:hypothetical protein